MPGIPALNYSSSSWSTPLPSLSPFHGMFGSMSGRSLCRMALITVILIFQFVFRLLYCVSMTARSVCVSYRFIDTTHLSQNTSEFFHRCFALEYRIKLKNCFEKRFFFPCYVANIMPWFCITWHDQWYTLQVKAFTPLASLMSDVRLAKNICFQNILFFAILTFIIIIIIFLLYKY